MDYDVVFIELVELQKNYHVSEERLVKTIISKFGCEEKLLKTTIEKLIEVGCIYKYKNELIANTNVDPFIFAADNDAGGKVDMQYAISACYEAIGKNSRGYVYKGWANILIEGMLKWAEECITLHRDGCDIVGIGIIERICAEINTIIGISLNGRVKDLRPHLKACRDYLYSLKSLVKKISLH